jgi:predicted nucleotidyltransferase
LESIHVLRCRIAREAAALLYSGVEEEYKLAKLKAASALHANLLPTNREVAIELDKIAEENEGPAREERLIRMRWEALKLMKLLKPYQPVLIGSVWRGTISRGSDIDIAVYHDSPDEILSLLRKNEIKIMKANWVTVTKRGIPKDSFHIYFEAVIGEAVEIVVRRSEEAKRRRKCEVFGDDLKGLNPRELELVLNENPVQKYIPS